jgi:predicted O-methyltransferase YrrM
MGFRKFDFRNYVDAIDGLQGDFDLIVIDGRAREACLSKALGRLAKNGMIVFDNTNRRRYQAEIRRHRAKLTVSNHMGLTPILLWPSMTSLIQLREN